MNHRPTVRAMQTESVSSEIVPWCSESVFGSECDLSSLLSRSLSAVVALSATKSDQEIPDSAQRKACLKGHHVDAQAHIVAVVIVMAVGP